MKRVVFNQKGGVGKSSITVNLAAISAVQGLKTLVIDLDPQANASQYLLGSGQQADKDIGDFFNDALGFQLKPQDPLAYVAGTRFTGLDLIAANQKVLDLQAKLESKHKIYKLRDAVDKLSEHYDAIYIDTPPAFNFFSLSALVAADRCLVPFDCDEFARQALYSLLDNVHETRIDHNQALQVEGIVVNQFQPRASLPQQIVSQLEAEDLPVLQNRLSHSVKMRESHQAAEPLIHFAPKHKLTAEFEALFQELHQEP